MGIESKNWEPKKMTVSQTLVFVLNQKKQTVTIYDEKFKQTDRFEIFSPFTSSSMEIMDIAFDNEILYIVDRANRKIYCYTPKGKILRFLGGIGEVLHSPSAIFARNNQLWIADLGCIWVTDEAGTVLHRIVLPEDRDGFPSVISDITYFDDKIYATNITLSCIQIFDASPSIGDEKLYGGFGHELGRFTKPGGIAVEGNIFVSDPMNNNIQSIHPQLESSSYFLQSNDYKDRPSDVVCWNHQLVVAGSVSNELVSYPIGTQKGEKTLESSTTILDFGSLAIAGSQKKQLTLYSSTGYPITGIISVDNPCFEVSPQKFSGSSVDITVSLSQTKLKSGTKETGKITILLDNGEKKSIEARVKINKDPDFQIVTHQNYEITDTKNTLFVTIEAQNGCKGSIEFSCKTGEIPFNLQWEKQNAVLSNENTIQNQIKISPFGRFASGFYTLTYLIKAPAQKIIKQGSITFLYKNSEGKVPGTMLGEFFSADWCEYCPSGYKALTELDHLYSKDQLNLITYYNDCSESTPQRLCFPEGESRMKSYTPVGMHVTLILNGTNFKEGGYNGPNDTMTKEYREMIDTRMPYQSSLSLSGTAKIDRTSKEITVGATVECLQDMNWTNPRLYCVLTENKIDYPAKNKVKVHDMVVRDFMSMPNPEKNDSFGTPLLLMDGSKAGKISDKIQFHLQSKIDPGINLDNVYCLLFIQDNDSKQIYQSRYVNLYETPIYDFDLYSEKFNIEVDNTSILKASFRLSNLGNQIEDFMLDFPDKGIYPPNTDYSVDGIEYSILMTSSVRLNPFESAIIEIKAKNPMNESQLQKVSLKATNLSSKMTKTNETLLRKIGENQPRYEFLSPNMNIMNPTLIFRTNLTNFSVVMKTEPRTKLLKPEKGIAGKDGILLIPVHTCPGNNKYTIRLQYPDDKTETLDLYVTGELKMVLKIGSSVVQTNQKIETIEAPPYIKNGRTMVPLRVIAEAFCSIVEFDPASRGITIKSRDKVIALQIGNNNAMVNGITSKLDTPPEIKNGRTFLPLRFIVETFGAKIDWNAKTGEITITI